LLQELIPERDDNVTAGSLIAACDDTLSTLIASLRLDSPFPDMGKNESRRNMAILQSRGRGIAVIQVQLPQVVLDGGANWRSDDVGEK
jgi:hypothetical protein